MFEIGEGELSNSDIVNRYACADVYSFSLIAWLILSQCPALWDERPNERRYLEDNIDDYMFEEFMRQAFNRDEYQRRFDTGNIIQKGLSVEQNSDMQGPQIITYPDHNLEFISPEPKNERFT